MKIEVEKLSSGGFSVKTTRSWLGVSTAEYIVEPYKFVESKEEVLKIIKETLV